MNLVSTEQILLNELKAVAFDLAICASGYERRASHAACQLRNVRIRRKSVFGFLDRRVLSRQSNDRVFKQLGYKSNEVDGHDPGPLTELFLEVVRTAGSPLRVLVDYSCMTRVWYASLIQTLRNLDVNRNIELYFVYSPSSYAEPQPPGTNRFIGPISGFCQLELPHRETALILGLGYEKERAIGLVDYVEPKETYAFYTDPALEPQFVRTVVKNNHDLLLDLNRAGPGYVIRHPLANLTRTNALLAALCSRLSDSYRVILAPLGVKPFSLACLLMSIRFRGVDVWRVSAGSQGPPIDREPLGPILTLKASFGSALLACAARQSHP